MLAQFMGFSIRLWYSSTDPDSNVYTSASATPDIGEFFLNTTTGELFICHQNGVNNQLWQTTTNRAVIDQIISEISQPDWEQDDSNAPDFIRNKPQIPEMQIQSDWLQPNVSSLDFIKNKPSLRSQNTVSRSLNSIFQISSTRDSLMNYSVDISCSLSLLVGQSGAAYLEISPSATFASSVQEVCRFINSNTGALAVGLSLTQTNTARLTGYLPIGWYARIRTENITSTPTFTYRSGQEVLL